MGDEHPGVLGECFTGLLAIAPEECMALVASNLSHPDDAVRDFAALAPKTHAEVAVDALSVYERNARLAERVKAALAKRTDRAGARSDRR